MNLRPLAPKAKGAGSQGVNSQELTNAAKNGCPDGCTEKPAEHPSDEANTTDTPDAGPMGEHFAEAVAMLARLPLTDTERAEAVRRLLARADAGRTEKQHKGGMKSLGLYRRGTDCHAVHTLTGYRGF